MVRTLARNRSIVRTGSVLLPFRRAGRTNRPAWPAEDAESALCDVVTETLSDDDERREGEQAEVETR